MAYMKNGLNRKKPYLPPQKNPSMKTRTSSSSSKKTSGSRMGSQAQKPRTSESRKPGRNTIPLLGGKRQIGRVPPSAGGTRPMGNVPPSVSERKPKASTLPSVESMQKSKSLPTAESKNTVDKHTISGKPSSRDISFKGVAKEDLKMQKASVASPVMGGMLAAGGMSLVEGSAAMSGAMATVGGAGLAGAGGWLLGSGVGNAIGKGAAYLTGNDIEAGGRVGKTVGGAVGAGAGIGAVLGGPLGALAGGLVGLAGAGIYYGGKAIGDRISQFAKGGKQKVRDSGLTGLSDEEILDAYNNSEGKERKRYEKELKGRDLKNKKKRENKKHGK